METIEPSASAFRDTEHEPNFLLIRDTSGDWPRWKRAALGSAVFHLVAITALFVIKGESWRPPPPERIEPQHVVHLFVPKDLTQKAPNKSPVSKLIFSQAAAPSPKAPAPQPRAPKPAPPLPAAPPPPRPKLTIETPAAPEPNPGEIARNQPPGGTLPPVALPKPEAPKIVIDDSPSLHPAPRTGSLNRPVNPTEDAIRSMRMGGGPPAGSRSDETDLVVAGGVRLPPSVARMSSPQLKSDPMGVDFSGYLQQVLTAVKLNWSAVFPTAARLGLRGITAIEFSVAKDGKIAKVVFLSQSGARALDNASVAAISASNPLPPLPKDYRGDRIVLDMSFMYNIPRR